MARLVPMAETEMHRYDCKDTRNTGFDREPVLTNYTYRRGFCSRNSFCILFLFIIVFVRIKRLFLYISMHVIDLYLRQIDTLHGMRMKST